MADVFDSAEIVDFTLQKRNVAWLRAKYGALLTWKGSPDVKCLKVWEVSQQMSQEIQFLDANMLGIARLTVRRFWPQDNSNQTDTFTLLDGKSNWAFGSGNHYNPATGQKGTDSAEVIGAPWQCRVEGMGWPDLTNHDHCNFVFQVGGATAPTPPDGDTVDRAFIDRQLDIIRAAVDAIDREIN